MNVAELEAEFLKNPNPSSTALEDMAIANEVEVLEVERWFEDRRLQNPEVQDQVQDVPAANDANNQDQNQLPVNRPAVVHPVELDRPQQDDEFDDDIEVVEMFINDRGVFGPGVARGG